MQMDKYQADIITNQKNPDINFMLGCSVEDLLKLAIKEDWSQVTFEKWLRVKEVQFLEQIAKQK